jgi:mRNA-degrading endonuclease RelE of RelBE toxin-antitoxin system
MNIELKYNNLWVKKLKKLSKKVHKKVHKKYKKTQKNTQKNVLVIIKRLQEETMCHMGRIILQTPMTGVEWVDSLD